MIPKMLEDPDKQPRNLLKMSQTLSSTSFDEAFHDRLCWVENRCICPMVQELLSYYASHDPQTGLANLDLLIERLGRDLNRGNITHVVTLMINGINEIGIHHSVAAGLYTLRTLSERIEVLLEGNGYAARMQGELFAVVSHGADPQNLATRLWEQLTQPIQWEGKPVQLVIAAGVVNGHQYLGSAERMLQDGLAAAKEQMANNKKGGIKLFTQAIVQRIERQYQIETHLRSALLNDGLSLVWQAKVCATSGKYLGAEALLRWKDPQLGVLSPTEFIPLAENNGTITDISKWVLRQAILEASSWHTENAELNVAINLSVHDLLRSDLIEDIKQTLLETDYNPKKLVIEVTESAVAKDPEKVIEQLYNLKAMGISISLDDFGTGYSSLSYLRRLPIDTLKIDRSFVIDTPEDADAVAIVNSIVALARILGMKTVAEGVETSEQAKFLRDIGVDILQGYLFSPPVPIKHFLALTMKHLT